VIGGPTMTAPLQTRDSIAIHRQRLELSAKKKIVDAPGAIIIDQLQDMPFQKLLLSPKATSTSTLISASSLLEVKRPSDTKKCRASRQVRFELLEATMGDSDTCLLEDHNTRPLEAINTDCDRVELTDVEKVLMWWQPLEVMEIKQRAKRASALYRHPRGNEEDPPCDYYSRFASAVDTCTNSSGHIEGVPLLSNTPARGLEPYIFPEYHSQQRLKVVRSVLDAQRKLPSKLSADGRARVLNATSKHLTRPMRTLARLLANGDARVVAGYADIEPGNTE
jgi:hypothetical protein